MRETLSLRRRLLAGMIAFGTAILAWGVTAAPADAMRPLKPRPTPTPSTSPTPTPSPSPTPVPSCGFAVVPSPNASGLNNVLVDVSVLSPTDAWAVGEYTPDGTEVVHTLIQHYDGSAWTVVSSPNRLLGTGRNQINALQGVSAIAADDVWAVGYTVSLDEPYRTLTMHWNGTAWSIVDSPNSTLPGAYNALLDVAATGPNDVWAVGGSPFRGVSARALLLHWDGSSWSMSPGPPNAASWDSSTRNGVTALTPTDVWAVGDYDAWRFDGTAWTVPVAGAQFAADVHGIPGAVWAVGSYIANPYGGGVQTPIAYRFTGTSWQQHFADFAPGAFSGVAVRADNDVVAVGFSGQFTYAVRWNGTRWQRLASGNANPTPSSTLSIANVLRGVGHAGSSVWAVGHYYTGTSPGTDAGVQRTLIERFTC